MMMLSAATICCNIYKASSASWSWSRTSELMPVNISKRISHTCIVPLVHLDDLDNFTTGLVQKKAQKWNNPFKYKLFSKPAFDFGKNVEMKLKNEPSKLKLELVTLKEKNNIDYTQSLIKDCVINKKCPSHEILLKILLECALRGDKENILKVREVCSGVYPKFVKENSQFLHYMAGATWVKGNIGEAMKLIKYIYKENVSLRKRVQQMLKYLILDVVSNRSEGALINVLNFCKNISDDFHDLTLLLYIWELCFSSEWYRDQSIALELLEKHRELSERVIEKLHVIVTVSLMNHQTECVFRLLEFLLKHNRKAQYTYVISALLNYKIQQRDLHGSSEILRWCVRYDVELPTVWRGNYLKLLLKHDNLMQNKLSCNINNVRLKF